MRMAMKELILALDQGTTGSRALLFDVKGTVVAVAEREIEQSYPRPGWVEHDPEEIWDSQWDAVRQVLDRADVS